MKSKTRVFQYFANVRQKRGEFAKHWQNCLPGAGKGSPAPPGI
jgi:hypothetical protein